MFLAKYQPQPLRQETHACVTSSKLFYALLEQIKKSTDQNADKAFMKPLLYFFLDILSQEALPQNCLTTWTTPNEQQVFCVLLLVVIIVIAHVRLPFGGILYLHGTQTWFFGVGNVSRSLHQDKY